MLENTQSILCAFCLAVSAPRSPYRHLELCGIAFIIPQNARGNCKLILTPPCKLPVKRVSYL
ncbi:MAG: hypothetical protein PUD46_04850 [Subdoligranulum sp.]|nr:hypothetical protein [Subdoligranulum sp.]MDD6874860.1 hypothetical protein [Subdoligranulum sp.]